VKKNYFTHHPILADMKWAAEIPAEHQHRKRTPDNEQNEPPSRTPTHTHREIDVIIRHTLRGMRAATKRRLNEENHRGKCGPRLDGVEWNGMVRAARLTDCAVSRLERPKPGLDRSWAVILLSRFTRQKTSSKWMSRCGRSYEAQKICPASGTWTALRLKRPEPSPRAVG